MERTKIVFAGHDLKFARLIINFLKDTGDYDVRIDQWNGHNVHDEQQSLDCLNWADIIVCEWGLGNAVWYSHRKFPHQKLIVRMHLQEKNTNYPNQFDVDNIDAFIAISPYIYEEFYRVFKFPRSKMKMIYNVVDTKSLEKQKTDDAKYNLGIVGISPRRKRLDLALDILEKLWSNNNKYKLFIKGKMPQEYPWVWNNDEEREYYETQFTRIEKAPWKNAVIFEGFGEISDWMTKIGYVLSVSDFESFHLAPSEGMASGAFPLILRWDGCETIYREEYIFDSVDEIVERVVDINGMESIDILSFELKKYVKTHFDTESIGKQWLDLINELQNIS